MRIPSDQIDLLFDNIADTRNKVAIWRQTEDTLGKEPIFAIQVDAQAVNVAEEYLKDLPEGAKYISLDVNRMIDIMDIIASRKGSLRVLVYNLDQLLWRLSDQQRGQFWHTLLDGLAHRERSLVLMIPAEGVLPQGMDQEAWTKSGRLL